MYNTTSYSNVATGKSESGNYCGYVLMDYQLRRSNHEHPNQGWYAGGSWMTAPESLNPYARYYEARLYKLSYVNGPAISPRVPSALKFQASWTTFF